MTINNRIFWACAALGVAEQETSNYTAVHGIQSVSLRTTFNLEQVFELSELAIYETIEDIPDVEITVEKVLDGYPLMFHEATQGATDTSLVGRSGRKCNVALSLFGDTQNSASGIPVAEVNCSGLYLSSATYTLPVEGNCTESVTLVGNHKVWRAVSGGNVTNPTFSGALFDNTDSPSAATGVQRRENVKFGSLLDDTVTLLPSGYGGVRGISSSGTNDKTDDVFGAHVQSITISVDLGRDATFELGRRNPYFRFVSWPVEVTTEVEILAIDGDWVDATETGVAGDGNNLSESRILVVLDDSTKLDLGTGNKLSNVNYGGGDAGDNSNATITYSYSTFNFLTISATADPG